ncbi:Aste57867_15368 [Aphanomyces stellatus]|uniref:Aste57867_15368 protein n=1 Tax=Aphanomyces stellatus TaxID=120398 RepID=A0A485L2Z7_9STRA|nr:hypothetical protein As57867_015312 [Aphanomyces stellatus]VFT92175.1 Aste57867_15368 [Aphanomyces stellatus]
MLNAFSFGKSTALVCDVGASLHAGRAVVEGFGLKSSAHRSTVGGEVLTAQILHNKHKVEIHPGVRKYTGGPVQQLPSILNDYRNFRIVEVVRDMKESLRHGGNDIAGRAGRVGRARAVRIARRHSRLPRKQALQSAREDFRPGRDCRRLDDCAQHRQGTPTHSVQRRPSERRGVRKNLLYNMVLCGGGSGLPSLTERLHWDVSQMVPSSTNKVRIAQVSAIEKKFAAPRARRWWQHGVHWSGPGRQMGAWIGGLILASLGSFQQLWVSKREYDGTQRVNNRQRLDVVETPRLGVLLHSPREKKSKKKKAVVQMKKSKPDESFRPFPCVGAFNVTSGPGGSSIFV